MKVLLACECSGVELNAWRSAGHDAFSCDVQPCRHSLYQYHIQSDVRKVNLGAFDLVVAHPPCTHLSSAANRLWSDKCQDGRLSSALELFFWFFRVYHGPLAVENPVGFVNTFFPPSQIVNPWQFGDPFCKRTCLWLRGLPPLQPLYSKPRHVLNWCPTRGRNGCAQKELPGLSRADARSQSFPGLSRAMAYQWGSLLV